MLVPFDTMPDNARLWVFAASRALNAEESRLLAGAADRYLDTWVAHGSPLRAGHELRYGRFLLIAADPGAGAPSGCSIDGLYRTLKGLEVTLGTELTGADAVWYRDAEAIRGASREEFRALAAARQVGSATVVFDNSIATVGELRARRWEMPARDSWHRDAFGLQ